LRRLSTAATYLYHDGARYWYSTQPTVTKLADDRAEQLTRNPDKVVQELDKRVRADVRKAGDFPRVHALPQSSQDVPDDMDARLVVLGIDHPYSKEPGNAAEAVAKNIYETRGNAPRLFSNTLVFLALDKVRLQDLDDAIRRYLAWKSIVAWRLLRVRGGRARNRRVLPAWQWASMHLLSSWLAFKRLQPGLRRATCRRARVG
jgi:hypothetical protein